VSWNSQAGRVHGRITRVIHDQDDIQGLHGEELRLLTDDDADDDCGVQNDPADAGKID
jgi:hypothetical protein